MDKLKSFVGVCVILLLVLSLTGLVLFPALYPYVTAFERDIVIKKSFQNVDSSGDGKSAHTYMVTDMEGNSYEIHDSILRWQFRSTDLWTSMEEGESFHVKCYGWRCGFLSMYPNIYKVEKK